MMMKLLTPAFLLTVLLTGCRQDRDLAIQQTAPRIKPMIAVVPVMDHSEDLVGWSLGDEFTSAIQYRLSCNDQLYLVDLKKAPSFQPEQAFGLDVTWMKKAFPKQEFVAFLELIQHDEQLRQDKKNPVEPISCAADLHMSIRLRIFDLRQAQPKVVLQEIVSDSHFIPRPFTRLNFHQTHWGEEGFDISPMGIAHAAFAKAVSKRIEDYVLLSQ